jgi:small-conductance mechanosensitive channel
LWYFAFNTLVGQKRFQIISSGRDYMSHLSVKIFWAVLLSTLFLMPNGVLADEQPQGPQPSDAKREKPLVVPHLADLIPLATKLSGSLVVLEKKIVVGLDISSVEKRFSLIMANLEDYSGRLQRQKDSGNYRYDELIEIESEIQSEDDSLKTLSKPITKAIRKLGDSRKKWLDERKRWNEWEQSLLKDQPLDEVQLIFKSAQKTIDTALSLILQQLKPMLAIQQRAGNIQTMTSSLTAEIKSLVLNMKRVVLIDSSPPIFSYKYFAQYRTGLLYELQKGLEEIKWPGIKFFSRQGWLISIQVLLSLALVIVIFRYRHQLENSKRGRFVAKRPFSAGLFVGLVALSIIYEGAPASWTLTFTVVAAISFARLFGSLIEKSWKSYLIYGLVIFAITARLLDVVSLPLPLFRLYIFLAALVGLSFFVWWAVRTDRRSISLLYTCGFWSGSFLFVVVLIAEFFGKSGLSDYVFRSSVRTILVVLVGWLFMLLARGGLDWILRGSTIERATAVYSNTAAVVKRLTLLTDVFVGFLVLSSILAIWRVYSSPADAIKGLLSSGFTLGSQRISVSLLIAAAGIFFGSFLISWAVQKLFVGGALGKHKVGTGVKISIARLIHYALISIGFFLALLALGFELTKLTIIVSAFGIGIGFGLQTIVNNFVCGLILLFERPVRVGDYIEIGERWAKIKRIGLRSTTVLTMERADIIIPNSPSPGSP